MGASTRIVPVFYRKMWNGSSVMMQCIYNVGLPDLMTICCPVGLKSGKEQTSLLFLINMLKQQADLEDCKIEKCKTAYVERYLDDGSSASGCARHSVAGVSLNRKTPYPTDTDSVAKFLYMPEKDAGSTGRAPVGSGPARSGERETRIMAIRSTVHAAYLRWLLPIIVLLIMATALILGPALFTHAAGTGNTTAPSTKPANTAPAKPSQSSPSIYWVN